MPVTPAVMHQVGQKLDGFTVEAVTPLPHMFAVAYRLSHDASGARLLHVHADDAENLFSISFLTPPTDDTGVPHILEHMTLAGSKRFPVREPFFELAKSSMATYLNAMTGFDTTYYPVSSNVRQDLFNLAEVYFDAVFHPLLTEMTFRREGHHLAPVDPAKPTGDLTVSGIVYNEMKGFFSNPEYRLYLGLTRSLFPDTPYGKESGGVPQAIPNLTHAQLRQFHATLYHPANAHFCLYGDIPTTAYLDFLRPRLAEFTRATTTPPIPRQPRWQSPRHVEDTYPISAEESAEDKTYLALAFVTGDATDPKHVALMNILGLILAGNEGAPLKKALIDSQLGQDVIYCGDSAAGLESTFLVGLKGSQPERAEAFVKLVTDTLAQIAGQPIDPPRIAAAFQQAAYHYLEILPQYPLHLMSRVLDGWLYGRDPLTFLNFSQTLADCRTLSDQDPQLFNRLIREKLLDNAHRLTLVMKPDARWQEREDQAFAQRMQAVRAGLSDEQCRKIAEDAAQLQAESGTPNSPEALAMLPQLQVADLPREPRHIPTTAEPIGAAGTLLRNDVFTNGVTYLQLHLNLVGLPEELWPFVPHYCDAIGKLGVTGQGFDVVAQRVAGVTGGIGCWPSLLSHADDPDRPVWGVRFSLKALDGQLDAALDVLHDLLFNLDPRDQARLRDVVVQNRAHYRTSLVNNGMHTAGLHAARGLSPRNHLSEIMGGYPQLPLANRLADQFDAAADELIARINAVRMHLLSNPARLTASVTGAEASVNKVRTALRAWTSGMGAKPIAPAPLTFTPMSGQREALAGPLPVAYCVQAMPAPHYRDPMEPATALGSRLLSMEYVLAEVRFKGNAYGASFAYDSLDASAQFGSYRDPHITRTLDVFRNALEYAQAAPWTQADVDRAIIGLAKHDEKPIRPGEATGTALLRHLLGITPEKRTVRAQRLRSAKLPEVRDAIVNLLRQGAERSAVCVVSSREKIAAANAQMTGRELAITDLV